MGIALQEVILLTPGATTDVVLAIEPWVYETNQVTPGDTFSKGAKIYWNPLTSLFTTSPTAIFAGTVVQAADANGVIWFVLHQGSVPEDILAAIGDMTDLKTTAKDTVVESINELAKFLKNNVQTGLLVETPKTASTHGDVGAFDFNVDIGAGLCVVNGVLAEFAAQEDFDVDHGDESPVDGTNTDIIYTIVAAEASGTVTIQAVGGAAAPAETVAAPTDEAITTAVGHGNWIKIGQTQIHRFGAAACTQTYSNSVRPVV